MLPLLHERLSRRRRVRHVLGEQGGLALVFVLLALTVMSTLALTFLLNMKMESQSVAATRDSKMALYAADAAMQEVLVRLNFPNPIETRTVNGSDVRVWVPWDLVTTGTGPADWRFVHDDGVNNGAGSAAPCGGSGLNDCSGVDTTIDDFAEVYPNWRVNFWFASQQWVDTNRASLPADEEHYATLFDFTSRTPLLEFGVNPNASATSSTARSRGGIFVKRKVDAENRVLFTDGKRQFTAQQAILAKTSGGIELKKSSITGKYPAWPVSEIYASGRSEGASRRLVAEAANFPVDMPQTALYVCGDPNNPPTVIGGGAFLVSGYDYRMFDEDDDLIEPALGNSTDGMVVRDPNNPETGPVAAVSICCHKGPGNCTQTNDEIDAVNKQISGAEYYGGNTGDGDTVQVAEMDVQSYYEAYVPFISTTGCGNTGCDVTTKFADFGTSTNSVVGRVTAMSSNETVQTPNRLYGVLLLNAPKGTSMKFSGNATIYGLVIAVGGGMIEFQGTFNVVGAMYVGADVKMGGNPKLFYSREALSRVRQLTYMRLLRFWEERI